MLVTVLEVLDMTIVNVALPPMMGSLGANSEEITWVLTTYIVSAAIFMPLTGLLIETIGQKKLLLINIIGFCIASMLCGLANSLMQMIFYRTLQGIFGASLVPLSQFILRNTYSKDEQGKAMAFWGMGVMVAPVLGPTLGGYITESLNWRWVFYINLPICIFALFMSIYFIKETTTHKKKIDALGLFLMMSAIGALQIFLDQGNSKDWFASNLIAALFTFAILAGSLFIFRGINNKENVIDLSLFSNRNFALCCILILGFMISLFGVMAIQPMMLESLMNYPTADAGLLMAPRALASAISMAVVSQIINKVNPKKIIITGLFCGFISCYLMSGFQLNTPAHTMIWVGIIQGIGMGLFFVPVSMVALSTLSPKQTGEASGLFSLSRSIGSSIGISLVSMLATRETQINWHALSSYLTDYNPNLKQWLMAHQLNIHDPMVAKLFAQQVLHKATFTAFIDSYLLASLGFICLLPLVFYLQIPPSHSQSSLGFEH